MAGFVEDAFDLVVLIVNVLEFFFSSLLSCPFCVELNAVSTVNNKNGEKKIILRLKLTNYDYFWMVMKVVVSAGSVVVMLNSVVELAMPVVILRERMRVGVAAFHPKTKTKKKNTKIFRYIIM